MPQVIPDQKHLSYLDGVLKEDRDQLLVKEKTYKSSWKQRGGVGAFMMLARKWDRLENQTGDVGYDIFRAVEHDMEGIDTKDGVIDDIRDLRRYLALVEAELLARDAEEPKAGALHPV